MTRTNVFKRAPNTMHALLMLFFLLTSCEGDKELHLQLSADQIGFLTVNPPGTTVRFNEDGDVTTSVVGPLLRYTVYSEPKVGMFSNSVKYYREYGDISYEVQGNAGGVSIGVNAIANAGQGITIYSSKQANGSHFTMSFDKVIPSKTINGVTYKNVFLGISINQDTLYWKTGIGILGWKLASDDYTAYRVF